MKKILILALALVLSGCGALSPVTPTSAPPPTAQVIIATVLVPVVATQPPTPVPTDTPVPPSPTPQVIVVTATSANTAAAPAATTSAGAATATATLPSDAGGLSKAGVVMFSNLTRSGSYFNLRCPPQDITFSVSTSEPSVVEVDMYYHLEDLTTQPVTISGPENLGKMTGDGHGNYTLDVNTLQQLSPDLRASARAWFDYQFVGLAKDGNRVGSSGVITQQVLYLKDCP
ncbi:MAG: hypothetical protein WBW94_17435 [Anaerolineales bacterium]